MTELEERLLAEVTKLEDGMSALSGQLTEINTRLDSTTKLMNNWQDILKSLSEEQQNLSPALQKLQEHFTE